MASRTARGFSGWFEVKNAVKSATMKTDSQRFRWLATRIPPPSERRLVVITGARQTGKTTLVRRRYPALRYLNFDALEDRERSSAVAASAWALSVGPAVIDEAQKAPGVFEKVKYAYDAGEIDFSVLTGSSRILLLDQVRESLAGRAFLYELWPMMASEIPHAVGATPEPPLLDRLLGPGRVAAVLREAPAVLLADEAERRRAALRHLAAWGGMPELLRLGDEDRRMWLRSYQQTYLERDVADLARLRDLEPFRRLQRICMARAAQLLSYSDLSRDAAVPVSTVRRYLEYLELSYQLVRLPPYSGNATSTLVKAPKLLWTDMGLLRQTLQLWGPAEGAWFENLVIAEVHKWVSTCGRDAVLCFYRTRSGLEVDLVIQTPAGVIGMEIKSRPRADPKDLRGLRALASVLGDRFRGGLVVTDGDLVEELDRNLGIWAVPAYRLVA